TFTSDGGGGVPGRTEKQSPCACPSSWYGSCPSRTTFTPSSGVSANAANTSSSGGNTRVDARAASTKRPSSRNQSASSSAPSTARHDAGRSTFMCASVAARHLIDGVLRDHDRDVAFHDRLAAEARVHGEPRCGVELVLFFLGRRRKILLAFLHDDVTG